MVAHVRPRTVFVPPPAPPEVVAWVASRMRWERWLGHGRTDEPRPVAPTPSTPSALSALSTPSMLSIRGLTKSYGTVTAVDGGDLDIAPGEICALLGPNGAGKTTLVSIVAGLRRADAGTVTVDGIDARRSPLEACRRLGLASQELGLYLTL